MNLLDRINDAALDTPSLNRLLANNALEITDWLNKLPHNELLTLEKQFRSFILLKVGVWSALPKTPNNLSFLALLLEKVEQLGQAEPFRRLYAELSIASFNLGSRMKGASLYLSKQPNDADEYRAIYEPIYNLLNEAAQNEDDSPDKVLSSIIHYYLMGIEGFGEFNVGVAHDIRSYIHETRTMDTDSFLHHSLITNVLAVSLTDPMEASEVIHGLLDEYLERDEPLLGGETGLLVEDGTTYCGLLEVVDPKFNKIRDISVAKHDSNPRRNAIYNSLNRGIKIIDSEEQLFAYMTAFGPMHSEKLISALETVEFGEIEKPITVIDWGAGQGTATMMLFDFFQNNGIGLNIKKVILIEPSQLALKRGARHSLKFDETIALDTINKPLDSLLPDDFKIPEGTIIHLFSNILDVDQVSLVKLINLVKSTFPGENYFICVSPNINFVKTQRLNTFRDSFEENDLEVIYEIENAAWTWIKQWTRVVRVFKAVL